MMDMKKLLQEMVVPELREIKSDVRELRTRFDVEIRRLDEKIDSLDKRIDSLRCEMQSEFKRLDEKIDISLDLRDRMAALEAKIAILSR